ncbi:hypothetical protein D3C87_1785220 [compost metagenome]
MKQRERGHHADAQPRAHHAHHGGELLHLHQRVHGLRVQGGLQVLAHAAGARQVDEGPGGQVLRGDRLAAARQRVVGWAHQVEVVAAKRLGLQRGRVGADRGQCKVGMAAGHAVDAGL